MGNVQGMSRIDCVHFVWANFGLCWLKLQIVKPLWLVMTAGSVVMCAISSIQDTAARCTPTSPPSPRPMLVDDSFPFGSATIPATNTRAIELEHVCDVL
jgi:hypothetical protein